MRVTLICLLALFAPTAFAQEKQDTRSAEQMMVDAHKVRATWGKEFPGFTAKVTVNVDGRKSTGTLTVTSEGKVELDLGNSEDLAWARRQLRSIAGHRMGGGTRKYNVSFADKVMDHPLGRLIKFNESKTHSVYRIQGDLITEVHRQMGGRKFIISVSKISKNPEGKLLPAHFNVSYWNAKTGELTRNEDYQEDWIRLNDFDLPRRRLMIQTSAGDRSVREIVLSNHKFLPTASAKAK